MERKWMDFKELKNGLTKLSDICEDLYQNEKNPLVRPEVVPGFIRKQLPIMPPEQSSNMNELMKDTEHIFFPGVMNWQSPRYFGYFPSLVTVTNAISDVFVNVFCSPGFMYSFSPFHTELENIMMDWTAKALGLPDKYLFKNTGGGLVNNSTTQSMLVVIHTAKKRKMKELNIQLNNPQILKFVGYYGEFSYAGNDKGLYIKDVYYRRSVPIKFCEKTFNLVVDAKKFAQMVENDIAEGLIPFFYGSTYGSTFSAAIDLTPQIVQICKKHKMWLAVDAAYLGPSWLCPQFRPDTSLLQAADSLTINFSKTLLMGVQGAILFIGDKQELNWSLNPQISFSFYKNKYTGQKNVIDYKEWAIGTGRRTVGLKFYFLYKFFGLNRLRKHVEEIVQKANYIQKLVEESKIFKLFSKPSYGLVCYQLCNKSKKGDSRLSQILGKKIENIEEGFSTNPTYKNLTILRLSVGNQKTTKEIIKRYFDKITEIAEQILQTEVSEEGEEMIKLEIERESAEVIEDQNEAIKLIQTEKTREIERKQDEKREDENEGDWEDIDDDEGDKEEDNEEDWEDIEEDMEENKIK